MVDKATIRNHMDVLVYLQNAGRRWWSPDRLARVVTDDCACELEQAESAIDGLVDAGLLDSAHRYFDGTVVGLSDEGETLLTDLCESLAESED